MYKYSYINSDDSQFDDPRSWSSDRQVQHEYILECINRTDLEPKTKKTLYESLLHFFTNNGRSIEIGDDVCPRSRSVSTITDLDYESRIELVPPQNLTVHLDEIKTLRGQITDFCNTHAGEMYKKEQMILQLYKKIDEQNENIKNLQLENDDVLYRLREAEIGLELEVDRRKYHDELIQKYNNLQLREMYLNSDVNAKSKQIQSLQQQLATCESDLLDKETALCQAQSYKKDHDSQRMKLEECENEICGLKLSINELQSELRKKDDELKMLKDREKLSSWILDVNAKSVCGPHDSAEEKFKVAQDAILNLKEANKNLRDINESQKDEIECLRKENKELKGDQEAWQAKQVSYIKSMMDFEYEIHIKDVKLKEKDCELEKLRKEHQKCVEIARNLCCYKELASRVEKELNAKIQEFRKLQDELSKSDEQVRTLISKIHDMNGKLDNLKNENARLVEKIEDKDKIISKLEEEMSNISEELKKMKAVETELSTLKRDRLDLVNEVEAEKDTQKNLDGDLQRSYVEIYQKNKEINDLRNWVKEEGKKYDSLLEEKDQINEQIEQLKKENQNLLDTLKETNENFLKANEEKRKLKADLCREVLETENERAKSLELQQNVQKLLCELKVLCKENQGMKEELVDLRNRLAQLEQEQNILLDSRDRFAGENRKSKEKADLQEQIIENLLRDKKGLDEDMKRLQRDKDASDKNNAENVQKLNKLQKDLANLREKSLDGDEALRNQERILGDLSKSKAKNKLLEDEKNLLEDKNKQLKNDVKELHDKNRNLEDKESQIRRDLEELLKKVSQLEDALAQLKAENFNLKMDRSEMMKELKKLECEIKRLQLKLSTMECNLEAKEAEICRAKEDKLRCEQEICNLKNDINKLNEEKQDLVCKLKEVCCENQKMKQNLDEAEKRGAENIEGYKNLIRNYEKDIDNLKQDKHNVIKDKNEVENQLLKLKREFCECKKESNDLKKRLNVETNKNNELNREINCFRDKLMNLEKELRCEKEKTDELMRDNKDLTQEIMRLEKQLKISNEEIIDLKRESDESLHKLTQNGKEIEDLHSQIKCLIRENERLQEELEREKVGLQAIQQDYLAAFEKLSCSERKQKELEEQLRIAQKETECKNEYIYELNGRYKQEKECNERLKDMIQEMERIKQDGEREQEFRHQTVDFLRTQLKLEKEEKQIYQMQIGRFRDLLQSIKATEPPNTKSQIVINKILEVLDTGLEGLNINQVKEQILRALNQCDRCKCLVSQAVQQPVPRPPAMRMARVCRDGPTYVAADTSSQSVASAPSQRKSKRSVVQKMASKESVSARKKTKKGKPRLAKLEQVEEEARTSVCESAARPPEERSFTTKKMQHPPSRKGTARRKD